MQYKASHYITMYYIALNRMTLHYMHYITLHHIHYKCGCHESVMTMALPVLAAPCGESIPAAAMYILVCFNLVSGGVHVSEFVSVLLPTSCLALPESSI